MGTREDWQRLCALLDDDPAVWEAVDAALTAGDDGWEALLDGLDEAGALAYLQADDTGMELTDALVQLPRVYRLQPDLNAVTDTDDLPEATRLADSILGAGGLRVVRLVEDDDAWPVIIVPRDRTDEIARLADAVDGEAVVGG